LGGGEAGAPGAAGTGRGSGGCKGAATETTWALFRSEASVARLLGAAV
jgi:hypothetical protein